MPAKDTGKRHALSVPMDYFKRPDRIQRWKGRLGFAFLILSLLWVAGAILWIDRGWAGESRGPVAAVHATWENRCTACHEPFTRISGNSWVSTSTDRTSTSDKNCKNCHAGPAHHENQTPSLACAACHHDHRGREASLVRLPDSGCTQCHAALDAHRNGAAGEKFQDIHRFDVDHPDFRSIARDPGQIKFNHALHMAAGMPREDGGPIWHLGDIPKAYRERYAKQQDHQKDEDPVLLSCTSCHVLDRGDVLNPQGRPGGVASRSTMQPITYETQCKACHFLTFDRNVAKDRSSPPLSVPHGLQPHEVRDFLWGAYANEYVAANLPDLLKQSGRPLPGRPIVAKNGDTPQEAQVAINKKLTEYEKYLYREKVPKAEKIMFAGTQTCGECHEYERQEGQVVPRRILPTNVPVAWFKHAVFDHGAHQALDCRACHEKAMTATEANVVLVPDKDTCLQCHAPQTTTSGGARFDCTECHLYHHEGTETTLKPGDRPRVRRPDRQAQNISEFLKGVR